MYDLMYKPKNQAIFIAQVSFYGQFVHTFETSST